MTRWRLASAYGALVGLVYGLTEYAFLIVAPMYRWSPGSLPPDHWGWTAAFVAVYTALGMVIGGAAALLRRVQSPGAAARVVVAAVGCGLIAGHAIKHGFAALDLVMELSLVLIAAVVIGSVFVPSWQRTWICWLASPWISLPLLLTVLKLKEQVASVAVLSGAILGTCAAVALAIFLAYRSVALRRVVENRFAPLTAVGCAVFAAALVTASLWLDAAPMIPSGPTVSARGTGRPNVLLIVLDTVRADHMSLYGYAWHTTPNLEALAGESVVYQNAVAASDMTLSSHGSMFTGLYPSWHRAHLLLTGDPPPLDPSFQTMAEILADNGYTTLAVLANCAYLRPVFRLDQGFQLYDVRTSITGVAEGRSSFLRDFVEPVLSRVVPSTELHRPYRRADQITANGLRIFDALRRQTAPFFLNLNYMDAHEPYVPPAPYRDLFPGRNPALHVGRILQLQRDLAMHHPPPTLAADLAHITSQYGGAIAYLDAEIRRLLDGLKQAGLYDNTLVIITSDHGEALGERSALGHPESVHQELVRVPLLIKYPRSAAVVASLVDTPVSSIDLLPTVLDVAGITVPRSLPGTSLRVLKPDVDRILITESFPNSLRRPRPRAELVQRALYQGSRKLILSATGQAELYNVSQDLKESRNLYDPNDPTSRQLRTALEQWVRQVPQSKAPGRKMDRKSTEALRSLGYVQ